MIRRVTARVVHTTILLLRKVDKRLFTYAAFLVYLAFRLSAWSFILWVSVIRGVFFNYRDYYLYCLVYNFFGFIKDVLTLHRYAGLTAFLFFWRYKASLRIYNFLYERPNSILGTFSTYYLAGNPLYFNNAAAVKRKIRRIARRRAFRRRLALTVKRKVDYVVDYPWHALYRLLKVLIMSPRKLIGLVRAVKAGYFFFRRLLRRLAYGLVLSYAKRKYYLYHGISGRHLRNGDIPGFVEPDFTFDFFKHVIVDRRPCKVSKAAAEGYKLNEGKPIS